MKRIVFLVLPALVMGGIAFWLLKAGGDPDALHRHGIRGPAERTALPVPGARTGPEAYAAGGRNALALYVNDPSASWLGLVHGLKSAGVPVKVYTDPVAALRHRVVFVYPSLTGANMTPDLRDRLEAHVARGGTLIACAVVGGGLRDVFGFREALETRGHMGLRLSADGGGGDRGWRPDPEEIAVPLADPSTNSSAAAAGLPGVEYLDPAHPPLAVYDKGGAAIVGGSGGSGHAYAIGFDLGHFVLRAHGGRFNGKDRTYVNAFHPKVDGLMRMIRSWYVRGEPDAVTLRPAPGNRDFAALITHDVDYTGSMNNVEAYSADEKTRGVPATYFIQAKYVTDYNDKLFFDITRREELRRLAARGMEIASHSVAHSSVFRDMPLGTGAEAYPDYRPFVKTFTTQQGGTILGELRVSKYLLETLSGARVVSFRPGHLSLPAALPQALAATGYRFSSSITAGQAMTHLPYRTMDNRSYDAESPVYEFPVTLEDEKWELGERLDSALVVARAVGRHGGLVNVLIHTDEVGGKLGFEQDFHAALKDEAWFGTLGAYGRWWAARDRILLDVETRSDGGKTLVVQSPEAIDGLTLGIPAGWRLEAGTGARNDAVRATQSGNRLVLESLPAGSRTRFRFTLVE